jgi:hypothetical protein
MITPDSLINKIVLLTEYNSVDTKRHYRFADVIYHKGNYWNESTQFILNQPHLKESILRIYIEQCPDKNLVCVNKNHLKVLSHIINLKKDYYELPLPNELVIHLRLGDVVDFKQFLNKNYINIIRQYIRNHSIIKVTFCTAFHYGNNITQKIYLYTDAKHQQNIDKLQELFKKILDNFTILIDVKSSADIDNDFIYMVMAKHFVPDFGGFSQLIDDLHRFKNGKT